MAGRNRTGLRLLGLLLFTGALPACDAPPQAESPRTIEATLARVGKRLSGRLSAAELTDLASHGDRLLAVLNRGERDALGRGSLRFRIDRESDLYVVAPRGSEPF